MNTKMFIVFGIGYINFVSDSESFTTRQKLSRDAQHHPNIELFLKVVCRTRETGQFICEIVATRRTSTSKHVNLSRF